jgi:hypothetical protein
MTQRLPYQSEKRKISILTSGLSPLLYIQVKSSGIRQRERIKYAALRLIV